MGLHEKQVILLEILSKNQESPLKIREIQDLAGFSSPGHVHHHILQLEKKGYLKRNPNNSREYSVLMEKEDPITYLNLYGEATCGIDGTLLSSEPIDRIPVYSKFINFGSDDAFLVKAKGSSMTPKINNGDIVIVKKQETAEDKEIVLCTWEDESRFKVFRPSLDKSQVVLVSLNRDYLPIVVEKGHFKIEGIVRGIFYSNEKYE